MSADNRILILYFDPYGGSSEPWAAWHASASAEYCEPPDNAMWFPTKSAALKWANKEEEDGYLEYGVQELTVEEQTWALIQKIKDDSERLSRLYSTGVQFKNPHEDNDE